MFASVAAWALINSRPEIATASVAPPALLVDVVQAKRNPVTFSVQSQGSVAPRTQTTLVAEASDQIVEVSPAFVSGGFFRKDDVLVRIDPRNYESVVKRARAAVARAETQLATETATASYAKEDYARLQRLNPNTAPPSALALRKPQLSAAMAELQSAQADLEKAEGDLDRTVIRAPYDGLVRQKIADVGQYVNVGSQLATTFAIDIAEVRLPITQNDLQYLDLTKLRAGMPLDAVLQTQLGGETVSWPASITRSEGMSGYLSRKSRSDHFGRPAGSDSGSRIAEHWSSARGRSAPTGGGAQPRSPLIASKGLAMTLSTGASGG